MAGAMEPELDATDTREKAGNPVPMSHRLLYPSPRLRYPKQLQLALRAGLTGSSPIVLFPQNRIAHDWRSRRSWLRRGH